MELKSILPVALMFVALTLVVSWNGDSNQTVVAQQRQQTSSFVYARLIQLGDQQFTWDAGGNNVPRTGSLRLIQRELGGNSRDTLVNLLNAIGSNGWELVQIEEGNYLFKRQIN